MIAYAYILDLFKNVLNKSRSIKGRVYYAPHLGAEINSGNLDQTMKDIVKPDGLAKYPLALILPPNSQGAATGGFEEYNITMFFLKQSFITGNGITQGRNINTNTSKHEIWQDWHDMKRAAESFLEVLKAFVKLKNLASTTFRLYADGATFAPTTFAGEDRASGVQLRFTVSLYDGCVVEDYDLNDIKNIQVPVLDSHPEHKL